MRSLRMTWVLSILSVSCLVGAADAPTTDRWEAKSQQKGITALQRKACRQLAGLRDFQGFQFSHYDAILYQVNKPNPMTVLREMDVGALPVLAEALDDNTPSKTVTQLGTNITHKKGWIPPVHVWKVNELVALLIRDITGRQFVVEEGGEVAYLREIESHRDCIPGFQKQVLEWYKQNKDKTPEDRKIADLDSNLRNRLDAASWLGAKKSVKAVPFLTKRAEAILAGVATRDDSGLQSELAGLSLALGQIGDPRGLRAVQEACDHLGDVLPRSPGSAATQDLFTAYHGLALLGHKEEAVAALNRIYKEFPRKMGAYQEAEFQRRLAEAGTWQANSGKAKADGSKENRK